MAKKKALTLRDIFMKMERFTKDCFIIRDSCFIEGEEGFRVGTGRVFGYFTPEAIEVFKNTYPDIEILNVDSIRGAKDDPEHNIKPVTNKAIEQDFEVRYEKVTGLEWKTFELNEEELDRLFNKAERIEYEILPGYKVQIAKGLFPSMTIKRASDIVYYAELETNENYPGDMIHVYFKVESDYFTVYLEYRWL